MPAWQQSSEHLSTDVLLYEDRWGKAGIEGVNEFIHFVPTPTTPFLSPTWFWGQRRETGLKSDRVKRECSKINRKEEKKQ